jgi:splicing factor 45
MRKMGHVEGQGLGRTGDGIVHALAAEHVDAGKKKPAAGKGKGWVQAPSAKGRLVNMNEQTRQREEKARYGEPSRIVCLVNVLASVDDADQETMEDLGEKLKEHG